MTIVQLPLDANGNFIDGKTFELIAVSKTSTPAVRRRALGRFSRSIRRMTARLQRIVRGAPCLLIRVVRASAISRCSAPISTASMSPRTSSRSWVRSSTARRSMRSTRLRSSLGRSAIRRSRVPRSTTRRGACVLGPAGNLADRGDMEPRRWRDRVHDVGARFQRDDRQPDRGLGPHQHKHSLDCTSPCRLCRAEVGADPARSRAG